MDEQPAIPADILLVDDELAIRREYKELLEGEGYHVRTARDAEKGLAAFREKRPDLILLDVMMPRKNGIALCGEIRQEDATVPILFFTGLPSDISLVRALGCGGDDYIAKDRPPEEYFARIGAALRRARLARPVPQAPAVTPSALQQKRGSIHIDDVLVDFDQCALYTPDGIVDLTPNETRLLLALAGSRGDVVSYETLFAAIGGDGYSASEDAIRKGMERIRRKLGRAGSRIVVKRGMGYLLDR